jgi:hypothetical protein
MSEHPDRREKLLAEIFQGDWAAGPASAFARAAAAQARRRRQLRRGLAGASAVAAIAAGLVLGSLRRGTHVRESATPPAAAAAYEIISDDELLAQLRDRPVLVLPQENGTRKIVLFDR